MLRGSSASAVRAQRGALFLVGAAIICGVLTGCTAADDPADPAPRPASPTASASSPPDAQEPQLVPDGTAADNLPLFAQITAQVWGSEQRGSGRAYVDALTAAGFDRDRMQVTEDLSTVGNPAESLQFSVAWGDAECLIGQVGPSTGDPVTSVMPQLAEGRCLVGSTRPIDW
ncbi:hypothetical protein [Microbacterium sp. H1-D42]|uniref:DUF6993 domain-containing protein n=1 Tax=Microbacterium sp. H1-D42 TaxID=2925844 RepID=UPI001F53108B|nr:hypothetical protein [Microbacterium sp. H1-D42]UNK72329.1 hypothetical protein MNR00_07785 [Microbacterium sp. H1-D42]